MHVDRSSTYGRMPADRAKCCCGGVCYIIPGISPIRASAAPRTRRKRALNQVLTSQFPTHPNREFFCRLQGIKSGDQGKFRPDQGIPLSSAIWAFAPADNPIVPTDLEPCREGEQGGCQMLEVAEPISSPALSVPRRAANRSPSASTRTIGRSGLHDGGAGPSHAPECTELTVEGDRGFESCSLRQSPAR